MVLVQRKRRRWGAFITLDGPALIASTKACQQSAWRQNWTVASREKVDIKLTAAELRIWRVSSTAGGTKLFDNLGRC